MNTQAYHDIINQVKPYGARLVAVSKTKPAEDIVLLYNEGQRIFGENKAQEIIAKHEVLPKDIEWHFIGHLQTNKVKQIVPFVSLIHSVDSLKLLAEINKHAQQQNLVVNCLLQVFIADEVTKYGLSFDEVEQLLASAEFAQLHHVRICGLMGMATNTEDETKIAAEFAGLKAFFDKLKATYFKNETQFKELSMGMSGDYPLALKNGASLIRIGSILFGSR